MSALRVLLARLCGKGQTPAELEVEIAAHLVYRKSQRLGGSTRTKAATRAASLQLP